jgi:anti-sigma regulatory factor (Ser/Thr protein kinase)
MPSIERKFTLHVPSSTENLALIREFVAIIGMQAGLTEDEVAKIELAVDEGCANVIEHAYGHDLTKEVVVRAIFDDDKLWIKVEDTGRGFDPSKIHDEDLHELVEQRKSGGLGMRLIKTLMDEVSYEIVPGEKNELNMMKRLRKTG